MTCVRAGDFLPAAETLPWRAYTLRAIKTYSAEPDEGKDTRLVLVTLQDEAGDIALSDIETLAMGELWLAAANGDTYPSLKAIGTLSSLDGFLEEQPNMVVGFYAPASIAATDLLLRVNTADGPATISLEAVPQSE